MYNQFFHDSYYKLYKFSETEVLPVDGEGQEIDRSVHKGAVKVDGQGHEIEEVGHGIVRNKKIKISLKAVCQRVCLYRRSSLLMRKCKKFYLIQKLKKKETAGLTLLFAILTI
jgi:hypothetical protein